MARIVRFDRFGGPEVLRVVEEKPRDPDEGEVRIAVAAFGLNRAEVMFRNGAYVADAVFPSRIGIEAVGTVNAVGAGVTGFKEGDRVNAIPLMSSDVHGNWTGESVTRYGTYGDSAVLPAHTLVHTPDNLSDVEPTTGGPAGTVPFDPATATTLPAATDQSTEGTSATTVAPTDTTAAP